MPRIEGGFSQPLGGGHHFLEGLAGLGLGFEELLVGPGRLSLNGLHGPESLLDHSQGILERR